VNNTAGPRLEDGRRDRVLIRADSGCGTREFLAWLAGRPLHYSISTTITGDIQQAIMTLPERIWEPAYDADGQVRPGAWVADLIGLLDLADWPAGMRVIIDKEHPYPPPNCGSPVSPATASPPLPQRRSRTWNYGTAAARCEGRIRKTLDTGLRNLPLHEFTQNQLWYELGRHGL
jgi:hypothetical protein